MVNNDYIFVLFVVVVEVVEEVIVNVLVVGGDVVLCGVWVEGFGLVCLLDVLCEVGWWLGCGV